MHQARIRWGYYYTFGVANTPDLGIMLWNMTPNACRLLLGRGLRCRLSSPFRIVLPSEEQVKLEIRARKNTPPYRDVIRDKITLFTAQALSTDVIATRLDTPRQTVSKWRKRFALMRLPGLEEQPRGGRPANRRRVKALGPGLHQRVSTRA